MIAKRLLIALLSILIVASLSGAETMMSWNMDSPRYMIYDYIYGIFDPNYTYSNGALDTMLTVMIWTIPEAVLVLTLYELGRYFFAHDRHGV